MPHHGERVFVRPRHGLLVQRGDGLYQQYLAKEGQEVTWDPFLEARYSDGSISIVDEKAEPVAPPSIAQGEVHG